MIEAEPATVICVDQLQKTYSSGWFGKPVTALAGVSFDVRPGEIFGLLGPNGAGKTTLIKVVLGIVRRSAGQATLLGYPAGDQRGRIRVGYLPENLRVPWYQSARTALEFYGQLSGMSRADVRGKRGKLLELVGLAGRDRESVKRYSKGMLQRLGLAQALLHDPDVLMLDEPTDGLDPVGRRRVRDVLVRLRDAGRTVFLNSHLLAEVEQVCDRVAILDAGELRYVGTIADLTPAADGEIELELAAPVAALQRALPDLAIPPPSSRDRESVRIRVAVNSQADIDSRVDDLRAADVSIVSLRFRKCTLEDAFLELVKTKPKSPEP